MYLPFAHATHPMASDAYPEVEDAAPYLPSEQEVHISDSMPSWTALATRFAGPDGPMLIYLPFAHATQPLVSDAYPVADPAPYLPSAQEVHMADSAPS